MCLSCGSLTSNSLVSNYSGLILGEQNHQTVTLNGCSIARLFYRPGNRTSVLLAAAWFSRKTFRYYASNLILTRALFPRLVFPIYNCLLTYLLFRCILQAQL